MLILNIAFWIFACFRYAISIVWLEAIRHVWNHHEQLLTGKLPNWFLFWFRHRSNIIYHSQWPGFISFHVNLWVLNSGPINVNFVVTSQLLHFRSQAQKFRNWGAEPSFELELYVENHIFLYKHPPLNPLFCEFWHSLGCCSFLVQPHKLAAERHWKQPLLHLPFF